MLFSSLYGFADICNTAEKERHLMKLVRSPWHVLTVEMGICCCKLPAYCSIHV